MKEIKGNLFDGQYDILAHCANTYCTFGAGVAKQIKQRYPEAYEADLATKDLYMDSKLGFYSVTDVNDGKLTIVNIYGQIGIGNDGDPLNRNVQYDLLFDAFYRLATQITKTRPAQNVVIGVPMLGCGLAGGVWRIVEAILLTIEEMFPHIEFHVYKP
jgi:O-acetyl-ADP-ribose deacetylase (regulator of RNase III)